MGESTLFAVNRNQDIYFSPVWYHPHWPTIEKRFGKEYLKTFKFFSIINFRILLRINCIIKCEPRMH